MDLALNNLYRLICHKTKPNQTKPNFVVEQQWYYLTHSWEYKKVHAFPRDISPRVNVIARLEFELIYLKTTVQNFNHNATTTSSFHKQEVTQG